MKINEAVFEMKKGNIVEVSLGQTRFKLSSSNIVHYFYPGNPWKYFGTLNHFIKVEARREFSIYQKYVKPNQAKIVECTIVARREEEKKEVKTSKKSPKEKDMFSSWRGRAKELARREELEKELSKPEKEGYKYTKKVLLPIEVPVGKYCWGKKEYEEHTRICSHFTNEHGIPECTLLTYYLCESLKCDNQGRVLKPKMCLELKNS